MFWGGDGVKCTLRSGIGKQVKFQSRKSSCGPAALRNALEALGIERSEDELAALCKQTATGGTTGASLRKALGNIEGVINARIDEARTDVAILRLLQALYDGRPVIVCVEEWGHWAVAVGVLGFGKRVVCVDSGDNDLVRLRTTDEMADWWCGPDGVKRPYWGVVV